MQNVNINWGGLGDFHINLMMLVLCAPLVAFTIQIFCSRWLPRKGDWLPTTAIGISLVASLFLFFQAMADPAGHALLMHTGHPEGINVTGEQNAGFSFRSGF